MDLKELEQMLHDATKGIAKVDKTYVNYDIKGQLFKYDIDFTRFLNDVNYILKREKNGKSD